MEWHDALMNLRLLLAVVMGLLMGCPPVLNNPQVGDDDDVGDDYDVSDDDDLMDDDDDLVDDDDDDVVGDCAPSEGFMELESSLGFDFEGSWHEGDLFFSPDFVEVFGVDGQNLEFYAPFLGEVGELLDGPGRVYWRTPGNSPWNQDALLAIEVYGPSWTRVVLGRSAVPDDTLSDDFQLWVETDWGGCGDIWETECGFAGGLPLWFESFSFNGGTQSAYLQPQSSWEGSDSIFFHLGGQYFEEVFCPDMPTEEYGWAWAVQLDDEPVLGIGGR